MSSSDPSSGLTRVPFGGTLTLITDGYGNSILLDIEHNRVLRLNKVAAEMWSLLSRGEGRTEIVAEVSKKYQVGQERVDKDLTTLIKQLSDLDLSPDHSISVTPSEYKKPVGIESYPWYGSGGSEKPVPSPLLVIAAFGALVLFDLILACTSMKTLCARVSRWPRLKKGPIRQDIQGKVCSSVEEACLWYPKKSMCLQRSAVTTCILRSYGVAACMVIGIRPMPFMAHAWVEVDGAVLNDRAGVRKFYQPMVSY